ncbi:MAG: DNA-directed RNA polymerase subunit B, partial [Nanobdellota archaeon]
MADVFIDYKFMGTVSDAKSFAERAVSERRMNKISQSVNVFFDETNDAVYFETSKGRSIRPLIVVKDGKSLLTERHFKQLEENEISWSDLVKQGVIEYLDAAEEENAYVALSSEDITSDHTHVEISPIGIVGVATGLVPFGNHN